MWKPERRNEVAFKNVYRWRALLESQSLRLEGLRFGHDNSVYLFDLKQTDESAWQSVELHVCRDNLYRPIVKRDGEFLTLPWTSEGPTKNESIHYLHQ